MTFEIHEHNGAPTNSRVRKRERDSCSFEIHGIGCCFFVEYFLQSKAIPEHVALPGFMSIFKYKVMLISKSAI